MAASANTDNGGISVRVVIISFFVTVGCIIIGGRWRSNDENLLEDWKELCQSSKYLVGWSVAQWLPRPLFNVVGQHVQETAWEYWEKLKLNTTWSPTAANETTTAHEGPLQVPIVHVQQFRQRPGDLLSYLETTYGKTWRTRPLLLKGLWNEDELNNKGRNDDPSSARKLSLDGLLNERLEIPYFTDARRRGSDALTPDDKAPIQDVVSRIVREHAPHKIGTQLLIRTYPGLIQEVAPRDIVTTLFGNYFTPDHVKGTGPYGILPAMTTVPLFVAWKRRETKQQESHPDSSTGSASEVESGIDPVVDKSSTDTSSLPDASLPYTALHCEPIANIAVQLSGKKEWTLVQPEYSYLVRPSVAPDGRAFFASWLSPSSASSSLKSNPYVDQVPTYTAVTEAGDAIWVPTWTWHRVDYIESDEIAIGASLFHFRVVDFVTNNPLFAVLVIPALVKELVGYNTQ